jgi:hypothetical protein
MLGRHVAARHRRASRTDPGCHHQAPPTTRAKLRSFTGRSRQVHRCAARIRSALTGCTGLLRPATHITRSRSGGAGPRTASCTRPNTLGFVDSPPSLDRERRVMATANPQQPQAQRPRHRLRPALRTGLTSTPGTTSAGPPATTSPPASKCICRAAAPRPSTPVSTCSSPRPTPGTRYLERRLKRWHKTSQFCAICREHRGGRAR